MRELRPSTRRALVAFLVALSCACCGHDEQPEPGASSGPAFFVQVARDGEPLTPPQDLEGVTIDIVPGVEYRLEIVSQTPGETRELATINRHPLELADGYVRIGPQRFGPLQVGDQVSIRAEGVFVNGERVGDVPPRPTGAASQDKH